MVRDFNLMQMVREPSRGELFQTYSKLPTTLWLSKSVEIMWMEFKEALDYGIKNSSPRNLLGTKNISHGSHNQLKEK